MKKLLLTGFEPFLTYKVNPTKEIVEHLSQARIGEYVIHSMILPVDFKEAGNVLMDKINKLKPDAIVSLGLAGDRPQITPERIAINVSDGRKDNRGYKPVDETIIANGPDGYFTTLPIRKMVEALENAGLPAKISNTAGAYVCNHVMYRALYYANQQETPIPSGFIHIPASHELAMTQGNIASWSMADLKKGVETCLNVLCL